MSGAIPLFAEHFVTASILYMQPLEKGEKPRSIASDLIGEPDRIINHKGLIQQFDWSFTDINDADEEAWQGFHRFHQDFFNASQPHIELPQLQVESAQDENIVTLCDNLVNTIPYPRLRSLLFKWQDEFEDEGAKLRSISYTGHPVHDIGRGTATRGICMGSIDSGNPTHGQGATDLDFLIPPSRRKGGRDNTIEFTLK
ncbi:MAG: hypothetical protein CL565_01325 [Alphaproteobacteria bacterium]|nr:hypothetical protein [Alphaproteobacteria bacterium]|tara:strand:+ start:250 stop:846 length:597 start_codon:yes stop_codon:yes gene_type:complete